MLLRNAHIDPRAVGNRWERERDRNGQSSVSDFDVGDTLMIGRSQASPAVCMFDHIVTEHELLSIHTCHAFALSDRPFRFHWCLVLFVVLSLLETHIYISCLYRAAYVPEEEKNARGSIDFS